jgi:hypothetical protein
VRLPTKRRVDLGASTVIRTPQRPQLITPERSALPARGAPPHAALLDLDALIPVPRDVGRHPIGQKYGSFLRPQHPSTGGGTPGLLPPPPNKVGDDLMTLAMQAAENVGFIEKDKDTGQMVATGKGGVLKYLEWAAVHKQNAVLRHRLLLRFSSSVRAMRPFLRPRLPLI